MERHESNRSHGGQRRNAWRIFSGTAGTRFRFAGTSGIGRNYFKSGNREGFWSFKQRVRERHWKDRGSGFTDVSGETQSYPLHVLGISQESSRIIEASVVDRIAMKNWWFNSTNILEREGYDSVMIRATDVTHAVALTSQFRREGFQVVSLEIVVEAANRIVTVITVMFTLIGGIALLVATIGIANTMVMAIYERTREIGILKAMGASRGEIRQMFMMEAGFIGLIGGVVGLVFGWLAGLCLNQGIAMYLRHKELPMRGNFFVVTVTLALGVVVFATFIGLVAGLLPAQRAAKLDPLQALRHE